MCETKVNSVKLYPGRWITRDSRNVTIKETPEGWKSDVMPGVTWPNDGRVGHGYLDLPLDLIHSCDPPPPPPLQLSEGMWRTASGKVLEIVKNTSQENPGDPWPWHLKNEVTSQDYYANDGSVYPGGDPIVSPLINAPGKYVRRDGKVVEVTRVENYSGVYIWNSGSTHQVTSAGRAYIDEGSQTSYDLVAPYTGPPAVPITKAGVYKRRDGMEVTFTFNDDRTMVDQVRGDAADKHDLSYNKSTGRFYFHVNGAKCHWDLEIIEFLRPLSAPLCKIDKPGVYQTHGGEEVTFTDREEHGLLQTYSGDVDGKGPFGWRTWNNSGAYDGGYFTQRDIVSYLRPLPLVDFPITKVGVYRQRDGAEVRVTSIDKNLAEGPDFRAWFANCGRGNQSYETPRDLIAFVRDLPTPLAAPSKYGLGRYRTKVGELVTITNSPKYLDQGGKYPYFEVNGNGRTWKPGGQHIGTLSEAYYDSDLVEYLGPLVPEKTREQKLTEARENAVEQVRKWYARVNANRSQPRTQAQKEFYEVARILSDLEDEIPF